MLAAVASPPPARRAPRPVAAGAPVRASLEAIRAERARRRLYALVQAAWPIVEPTTAFVPNWHLEAICLHLEAVTAGQLRQLMINVPPGHMKSLITCVFWPIWEWIGEPSRRWLFASHSQDIADRDALKMRRIIESDWFRNHFGDRFRLTGDQNTKRRYENDHTGFRIALSTGTGVTGDRGDRLVVDDPHDAKKIGSDAERLGVLEWWDQAFHNRVNDERTAARVVIMQRLHERDLAGHVLDQGGWEHLMLPAEFEPGRARPTGIGWADPRREEGALLWPERFPRESVEHERIVLGPYGFAGQQQQHPVPKGGGLFKRAWWGEYDELPTLVRIEGFVDSSFKVGVGNDPSAIAWWGADLFGTYYVIRVRVGKWEYPDLLATIHEEHAAIRARWPLATITIEDRASGQSAIQSLGRPLALASGVVLPALPVRAFPLPGDPFEAELAALSKQARAEYATPIVAAGRVKLPRVAEWKGAFILEHERFPVGAHDDQVDTTSMALIRLAGRAWQGGAAVAGERPRAEVR